MFLRSLRQRHAEIKQHNTHQIINLYTHSAGVIACGMISKEKCYYFKGGINHAQRFLGMGLENVGKGTVETKYLIESITDEKTWNF